MIKEFTNILSLDKTIFKDYLRRVSYPWEIFSTLKNDIISLGKTLSVEEYDLYQGDIWVARGVIIPQSATVCGPCIICKGTEIRPGAFIRGDVVIGSGCVIGNSCEIKSSIIFDGAQVPHFNYVGNSILGACSHLGAGAITSNLKSDKSSVRAQGVETGLKKLGSIIGDYAEIGCNTVLNPGTVIGCRTIVYPLSCVRGTVPSNSIYKERSKIVDRV